MQSVGVSAVLEPPIGEGSDSRETPRSRISGEEGRCSGGGGGEGGSAQQFCSSRTAPAPAQCPLTTNASKVLLNALAINNNLWYDPFQYVYD